MSQSLVSLPSLAKKLSLTHVLPSLSPPMHCGATGQLLAEVGKQRRQGSQSTLKSDSEAMSSSSSLVAEEAEIRVCCWLEVTRCGLLISP